MAGTYLAVLALLISSSYAAFQWELPAYSSEYGKTVALKCTSDDAATFEVYHKSKKIVTGGKYTVTSYTYEIDVRITQLTAEEAGEYECRVTGSTVVQKAKVLLKAYYPENGKTFYKTLGTRATVAFTVIAYPRPEIDYRIVNAVGTKTTVAKAGSRGDMRVGADKYVINGTDGHLTIFNVQQTDGGKYDVQSVGAGSQTNGQFTLVVGDKPSLETAPDASYKIVSGKPATLTCQFGSKSPPDTVKWEYIPKVGAKVDITKDASSGGMSLDGTNLKIASVDIKNEGAKLNCIGSNRFGETKASTAIEIVYVTPVIESLVNVEVVQGEKASIVCKSSGNPPPQVAWHKMVDKTLTKVVGQMEKAGNSTYVIASATVADAGTYTCVAKLQGMESLNSSATLTVTILTLPVISAESTKSASYAVGKGKSNDLKCVASGSPLPSIVFMKGDAVLFGATEEKSASSVTSTLSHIANYTSDAGTIECVAKNSVGNATHKIEIKMIDKPDIPTGLKASQVERTSLMLTWAAVDGASGYKVKNFQNEIVDAPLASKKIENLVGGKQYKFAVAAVNEAGVGSWAKFVTVNTPQFDQPTKVVIPKQPTKFDKNDITLNWEKPASDGGDPDLQYKVDYCEVEAGMDKNCNTKNTTETTVSLPGLKENTDYSFTITAINKRGSGSEVRFVAKVGSSRAPPPTTSPTTLPTDVVVTGEQKGLSGGAIAGIIIAVILILLLVIDLFCCFFNECGFTHRCYQACCPTKGKESGGAADDPEKAELKDVGNDHAEETKTVPEDKQPLEKKSEEV